ncbi:hypothetical protein SAMN05192550_2808 [Flavobacterium glycines]|uniref:Uncharacterized protein n=1 Tax=Flavobacterium glycines TaxID=551990 RepID=A0A1B9DSN4_9FLAO|nr:hypothetical protein [Flavobacterium glycines]OCB72707.1 hypothetical protein FBGL_05125 [Flavobacterium glycines]GEL11816.1 hypothetical protein FGL01_25550 [Flavobacterium glycines]SDJ80596.1 hypothetical protein SAMN05192550_2808 [Flavobacterium glycines]
MKIWEKLAVTAITESAEIVLNKGISALVICSDVAPHSFTTETISIWVEKAGKNIDIAKEMLVKDLVALGTYAEDIIQSNATLATIANCDLTQDAGYIVLSESETIKFKLRNLDASKIYELHGLEAFFPSTGVNKYERKSMGSEDVSRDFDVKGYDLASLQKDNSITEISLTHENGSVAKYTQFELEVMARSADSANVIADGVIKVSQTNRIVFPVHQIVNVNIRKEPGTRLDFSLRIDENDYIRYQMPAK